MAYTSNSEFDAETRVQKTNEVRPLDIYEGVHSILKRDIWKWLLGWSDTTTDLSYNVERAEKDPTYDYTDDVYPAKVVNGVPAPEYGDELVKEVWNPNRVDELGNPLEPAYEKVPATHQTRMEIDGTILPEHDLFLHEIYRYLSNLYPDHPDWIELLTHTEIVDAFENAAAMVDYKPDDKFFLLVAQNMENISDLKKADASEVDEIKKEELKLLLRNLTNNAFRRKFYGATDGMKMFASGVSELASVFPVGEYLPLTPVLADSDEAYAEKEKQGLIEEETEETLKEKTNEAMNDEIDIFDPNFKKPFRIIDWTGKSRDLPSAENSQFDISAYTIPGSSFEMVEIHSPTEDSPMTSSASENVNSKTFFRLPYNPNNIAYYSETDKSDIRAFSNLIYDNTGVIDYETLKPLVQVIKYKTTQRLPIYFSKLLNYGKLKNHYDVSQKVGLALQQRNIYRQWNKVDVNDPTEVGKVMFNPHDLSSTSNIAACILRNENYKPVRFTLDPSNSGLILEPSEMLKIYGELPRFKWNKNTREYDLLPDEVDNEELNPRLKNFALHKDDILSSNELISDYSYFSLYSYIGSNKGRFELKCEPYYKEGDLFPINFGEFSEHLNDANYTSSLRSYGLIFENNDGKPLVIFGSIKPIWDVTTSYIQPTSITFNLENIPEFKSRELLQYLYGFDFETRYNKEQINELRKNIEYFTFTKSEIMDKLNEVFKGFDFDSISLEESYNDIDLRELVDKYEDKDIGQFLVYHEYMNKIINKFEAEGKTLPESFSFIYNEATTKVFNVASNYKVIKLSSLDMIKDQEEYTLKGTYTGNETDTFNLSYQNTTEAVFEDFTFGKDTKVKNIFMISKDPTSEKDTVYIYETAEGIPNSAVIEYADFGHANIVEFGTNDQESYNYTYTFNKTSQNSTEITSLNEKNYSLFYDYDIFDIDIKDHTSKDPLAKFSVKVAFPKVSSKVSQIYKTSNDLKLNIIGSLLWKNFVKDVSPEDGKYTAETLIPVPLEVEATRESDSDNDKALSTLIFSGEENLRKYEALTTGDTVEGNGIPSGTYILQKANNEVILSNKIPKSGTHLYKFNCTVEAYPTDVKEDFINYKKRLREEGSLISTSPFNNGLWGSNEWPHVSQAYIDGLVDPQDFTPLSPRTTADIIYDHKTHELNELLKDQEITDKAWYTPLSSVAIGTKMYYEVNCKKLINLPNKLNQKGNLMNVEWLDYFDSNIDQIAQASESTNVGTNLMMQTDISGFYTRRENAEYTDDDLRLRFQTFGYDSSTVPCYIQLGTGGTAYQKYFKSPSLTQKPTVYGATFFDHPVDDIEQINEKLGEEGGDWKKRFVYSISDISVVESGSGLSSVDQPLFEMPLGEYDIQKNFEFRSEEGVDTGTVLASTKVDTVSASFQKQSYKNLTKKLPESAIQILNRDFTENKLLEENIYWGYKGEWKPSIKNMLNQNGKNTLVVNYPIVKDEDFIIPDSSPAAEYKYIAFSIFDAFSDFILDEKGQRTPINIPATSMLIYYKLNDKIEHRIILPDFSGVTFDFTSKAHSTNTPYLQRVIESETGAPITKYIPIYTSNTDNPLEYFKTLGGLVSDGSAKFTKDKDSFEIDQYSFLTKSNKERYVINITLKTLDIYDGEDFGQKSLLDQIEYSFDTKTKVLHINKNKINIPEGDYTTSHSWPSDEYFDKLNKIAHACYIHGGNPSAAFSRGNIAKCIENILEKFYRDDNAKIPIISQVKETVDAEGNITLTLVYEAMLFMPGNFVKRENIKNESEYLSKFALPELIPTYEGLLTSSIAFDSNGKPDELSFFDGTFGTVYISKDITSGKITTREFVKATVESSLRTIQDHENRIKLPRSFVADGSYNIELTLDPHFISKGYLYKEDDTVDFEGGLVFFNVSQSRIFYDDVSHVFYTFSDIYKKIEVQEEGKIVETFVKDETQLEKKVALSFEEQKFFKDTTYLEASLKAYNTQNEGEKDTNTIYALEPVKGIPYNTSKYSSSDRILDIEEIAFRSESDYQYEPVLFSNFTDIKGEIVGISKEENLVVSNFRKSKNSALTDTTLFAGNLKELDPVDDKDNIAEVCPPELSEIKIKKPFTGEKIQSTEGSEAEMNFKFYKNYLIFEGAMSTDAPSQVIASKSNGPEFENVLKVINAGDEIKAVACLNGGSAQARKSIKINQKSPFCIPQQIRWCKGEMIMAGVEKASGNLYVYVKKVPTLEGVTELNGFKVIKINAGDSSATITDVSMNKDKKWMLTLEGSNIRVLEIDPNTAKELDKYNTPQSDAAKKISGKEDLDIVVYNDKSFKFDKFKATDITIASALDQPTNATRTLYYASPDGSYNAQTTFYVDMSMQMPHRTNLANGINGLSNPTHVTANCYSVTETYESYNIGNWPYQTPIEKSTENGTVEKTLDANIVFTSDAETGNEAFSQGNKLFVKTDKVKSSVDERQVASQAYWINNNIPYVRDTLEQRLYSMDVNQFTTQKVGSAVVESVLTGAFKNALAAWDDARETFGKAWDDLSKEQRQKEENKTREEYINFRLKQAFTPYEYFLFETCGLKKNYESQVVDLAAFEKSMAPSKVNGVDYDFVCTYKMPLHDMVDGRKVVEAQSYEHQYYTDAQGKIINEYRRYVQDWLSYILPAVDDTVAGSNYILSENIKQSIINKSEVGTDLVFVLKNNQTIKLSLDKVTCAKDIANTDNWTAYTLPEQTFYLAKKEAGTVYVTRLALMEGDENPTEYSAPSVTHIKAGYEITNLYKLGTTIIMSGYFESLKTIKTLELETGASNTLKYNDADHKKPYIMYCQPGKQNLIMIDLADALKDAPDEKLTSGDKSYSLKNCDLVIGSVSTLNGKLIATLKPADANDYFNAKIEISKGEIPDSPVVTIKEVENTKTLGGANQVMVGATNSILYWQETGKGIACEKGGETNDYYIDYLYRGAVSFGTSPSISFKTNTMIQLSEGLQADENTESAYYRYLFAVKTKDSISNPFEYYKFADEYSDPNTGLLKVGEVQEEVGDEAQADKVYMYREAKAISDPNPDGYPSMEEDVDKVFYEYEDDVVVPWTNNNGKPIYLCNKEGSLINSIYSAAASRTARIAPDGIADESWEEKDGALFDFEHILQEGESFRPAGKPKLRDTQSFTELFEVFREDDLLKKELGECTIKEWNSNYGGTSLDKDYFPLATVSSNLKLKDATKYLIEIKDLTVYNNFKDAAEKDDRAAELYIMSVLDSAEEKLKVYPEGEVPPQAPEVTEEEREKAQAQYDTAINLINLLQFIKEKEGRFGSFENPFENWTVRFEVMPIDGINYIFDKKYEAFMLNKIRYIEGLVKVLYPSSVPLKTRVVTAYTGLYKNNELLGIGPNNKYPVTGIYYPLKGYGGLMNETREWSGSYLPWHSNDKKAFINESLMNTEVNPKPVLLYDKYGKPILSPSRKTIISKKPAFNSFDEMVTQDGRSVPLDSTLYERKKLGNLLSFGGVTPSAVEVFFGEGFPEGLKVEPGKEKYLRIRILSILDTTEIGNPYKLNSYEENGYKAYEEIQKDEIEVFPPNRVYFNSIGIPEPPVDGRQIIASNDVFAPEEMKDIRQLLASKIFKSKNNYAFYSDPYTNNNGIPIYQCNSEGKYIKYKYNEEVPTFETCEEDNISQEVLPNNEVSYTSGVLFNPKRPIYNTCEEWFMKEFYLRGQESNPFWQVIKVYPEFNTNTMRFDSKSKVFEYAKGSSAMQLVECNPEDTYIMMKKTTLRRTVGTKTTITPNASYIDLLPGEIYFLLSQPENETFKTDETFVKFGISYNNSFNINSGIHRDIWKSKHVINLPSAINISYTVNTTEDFADPDNKNAGIVRVSELALLDKNHQIVAYATFPPIEYRSDTQHISFTCFINHNACSDYHNK